MSANAQVVAVTSLLTIALVVGLGVLSGSVWVGLLCFIGWMVVGHSVGLANSRRWGSYALYAFVGLALIVTATYISGLAGRWLWTPMYLLVALAIMAAG